MNTITKDEQIYVDLESYQAMKARAEKAETELLKTKPIKVDGGEIVFANDCFKVIECTKKGLQDNYIIQPYYVDDGGQRVSVNALVEYYDLGIQAKEDMPIAVGTLNGNIKLQFT
jgi:hypothetical protein